MTSDLRGPTVCVVGSGGREHALATALARTATVIVAPGNPGIARLSTSESISCTDLAAEEVDADLWVIGPEAPLVDGLADRLRASGHLVLGPGADGAQLEGSKAWMKELLASAGVPTAIHGSFSDPDEAIAFLRTLSPPWVVKTDGLAAGKGVLVTDSLEVAIDDVTEKLVGGSFGPAGRTVVIEEGLVGTELSLMTLCDGVRAVPLAAARDYKRAGDGDCGPNTGGMGAYSPVPEVTPAIVGTVMESAVLPTLAALRSRGIDYRGILYAGVMLTSDGPKVLEFNVRFGDPETQVVLPRWTGDVTAVLAAAAGGRLDTVSAPTFSDDSAVCVVLAAPGYPDAPLRGAPIAGLGTAQRRPGVTLFASGVDVDPEFRSDTDPLGANQPLRIAGGRVIGLTAVGSSLAEARSRVYEAVGDVSAAGLWHRRDIAGESGPAVALREPGAATTVAARPASAYAVIHTSAEIEEERP